MISFEKYWNKLASDGTESDELLLHCYHSAKNAWLFAQDKQKQTDAELLNLSIPQMLLIFGEMNASERRLVRVVVDNMRSRILNNEE